jgi:hypothetical protein
MRTNLAATTLAVATMAALPATSQAGRPFATEDADILAQDECEWEGFVARERASGRPDVRGGATQLGCGLGVALMQLALAYGRSSVSDEGTTQDAVLLGKFGILERGDEQPLGLTLAWAVGGAKLPGDAFRHDFSQFNLVATRAVGDALKLHANLGLLRFEATRDDAVTWNMAAELSVTSTLDVGAEFYGEDGAKPYRGLGARWHLNEALSVNASYALQSVRPSVKLWTVGFKLSF